LSATVCVELLVGGLELRQRRQRLLVERADVGDLVGAGRRRGEDRRADREGERDRAAAREELVHS
jgi:hypothetical protein